MGDGNAFHSEDFGEKPQEGSSDDELLIKLINGAESDLGNPWKRIQRY